MNDVNRDMLRRMRSYLVECGWMNPHSPYWKGHEGSTLMMRVALGELQGLAYTTDVDSPVIRMGFTTNVFDPDCAKVLDLLDKGGAQETIDINSLTFDRLTSLIDQYTAERIPFDGDQYAYGIHPDNIPSLDHVGDLLARDGWELSTRKDIRGVNLPILRRETGDHRVQLLDIHCYGLKTHGTKSGAYLQLRTEDNDNTYDVLLSLFHPQKVLDRFIVQSVRIIAPDPYVPVISVDKSVTDKERQELIKKNRDTMLGKLPYGQLALRHMAGGGIGFRDRNSLRDPTIHVKPLTDDAPDAAQLLSNAVQTLHHWDEDTIADIMCHDIIRAGKTTPDRLRSIILNYVNIKD